MHIRLFIKKYVLIVYLLLVTFFVHHKTAAQQYTANSFKVSYLTQDNGLSQATNIFNYEDSKGFMWITAYDAINRWDGKYCKVYNKDFYFLNCHTLKQGYAFAEDASANIYIGSLIGLYVYEREKDRFGLVKIFTDEPDEIAIPFAFKDGKIWCYNRFYHIAAYDVATKKITYYNKVNIEPITSIHIYNISTTGYVFKRPFFDNAGILWICGNESIIKYDLKQNTTANPLHSYFKTNGILVKSLLYDDKFNKIIFSSNKGFVEYNIGNEKTNNYSKITSSNTNTIVDFNTTFSIFKIGNYYTINSTQKKKLYLIKNDFSSCQEFGDEQLKHEKIHTAITFQPNDKRIFWLRDDGLGYYIIDFNQQVFNKELGLKINGKEIFDGSAHHFAELPDKDILVVARPNLYLQKNDTKTITKVFDFKKDVVTSIHTDTFRKGVWINFNNEFGLQYFLQFYDGKTNALSNKKILIDVNKQGLLQDIAIMPDGTILGAFEKGLFVIDDGNNNIKKVEGLNVENAFKISLLDKNVIGVSYLNQPMHIITFSNDYSKAIKDIAIIKNISSFYAVKVKNDYWIGTEAGVYVLNNEFGFLKKFDANNGLSGSYIYGLLQDDIGNIWVSHQLGMSSINTSSHKIINYTKEDNIQDWDYNNRCFYKTTDGFLYFGGRSGYNYFKPPVSKPNTHKPEIYVDEIFRDNVLLNENNNANNIHKIDLDYKNSNLQIRTIVKDLYNGNMYNVLYRLKSKDSNWISLPNNSFIVLNNLAPGSYDLEIAYGNRFDKSISIQKVISIAVSTPFYNSTWFLLLMAIGVTALLLWFFNIRKLQQQKIVYDKQLAIANERTRITEDLHDDIGSSISSINVYSNVAHQLIDSNTLKAKDVIEKLSHQSKNLMENLSEIIWSLKTDDKQLMTLDTRIKNHINDVLGSAEMQYSIDIDKDIDIYFKDIKARKNIMLIVKEAINNITKYSNASFVHLSLMKVEDEIVLLIKDNGIGFDDAHHQGNGLTNMKKRVEELKGKCCITSSKNNGVEVKCVFNV